MNEKDQLIQNINGAMPVAQQMQKIEGEIAQIEEKIEKKKKFWSGMKIVAIIAAIILAVCILLAISGEKLDISILFPVPFIVIYILHLVNLKKVKEQIKPLVQKMDDLGKESALAWLPMQYRSYGCIYKIAEYVNADRANSLNEALNLLDQDIHRQQMRDAAALGAFYGAQSRG